MIFYKNTIQELCDLTSLLKKILLEPDEIKSQLRLRAKKNYEKTIKGSTLEIAKEKAEIEYKEGWNCVRENVRSIRVSKPKPLSEQLEDQLWCILAKMGFNEMSHGRDFTISVGEGLAPRQIDVFVKDTETALCVECTACETPKRKDNGEVDRKNREYKI
ncbi:MAG: hypothetical protein U5K27_00340 [Desulfotignum sp.]|nr:hypothetical protein [Desulfotignum sp.]